MSLVLSVTSSPHDTTLHAVALSRVDYTRRRDNMNENKLRNSFEKREFDLVTSERLSAFWLWLKQWEGITVGLDEFDCNGEGLCTCDSYRHDCLVLTDDEADSMENEYLDRFFEDCVEPEIPESIRYYFDIEAWKRDARMDGRGHCLSPWDGNEYDVEFLGVTYYIFKQ